VSGKEQVLTEIFQKCQKTGIHIFDNDLVKEMSKNIKWEILLTLQKSTIKRNYLKF